MLESLAADSDLRQKNDDVIKAARAEFDVPRQPPAMEEAQAAVKDEVHSARSRAEESKADVKVGKPRWERGGKSGGLRKYEARLRKREG